MRNLVARNVVGWDVIPASGIRARVYGSAGNCWDSIPADKFFRAFRGTGQAWIEIHREALLADWDLAVNGETPFPIEPLR